MARSERRIRVHDDRSGRSVVPRALTCTCVDQSGWWDLNPRPPGPEPGAIPSFATARFTEFVPRTRSFTSRILHQIARRSRGGRSVLAAWLEITLCSFGQKALTTSRFIWKVSTHFYHARTATCSIRPHKQRGDYPSIPDRGGAPRSFLAPYDHSTSSGSSTGYPESATSD